MTERIKCDIKDCPRPRAKGRLRCWAHAKKGRAYINAIEERMRFKQKRKARERESAERRAREDAKRAMLARQVEQLARLGL